VADQGLTRRTDSTSPPPQDHTENASEAGTRKGSKAMRFGLFGGAQAPRTTAGDPGRDFCEYIETSVEAERLGFYSTFLVEHHFSGFGQVSAPLDLLSWVAARTTSIRVGTAVLVLPWHDPVLLAERAATLDLLSAGRLDFGVGKGYRHSEFAGFCVAAAEAEARFEESLAVIRKAWSSDQPFSHEGRFWQYHDIVVEPPTAQKPHPPVWIAAGKPESVRNVAALGANLLLDQFASTEAIGERIALFKAECEARDRAFDPMDVAVARNVYVARDPADTSAALTRQASIHARMIERSRGPEGCRRSHIMAYADTPGATEAHALLGQPPQIIAGLQALQAVGVRYVLITGPGATRQSMQRFAGEVIPAFPQDN
jgi:alkanesulfonate monooxygenase SsuD/methylene tetrahydromethanopterin reductase-like flavin-dependent oxidoreductase (luciferase family)